MSQGFAANRIQQVQFADTTNLDSFGRLRVSVPVTLFDAQQEYGLDTLRVWDAVANGVFAAGATNGSTSSAGNAVGPRASNSRMTPITVSSTDTHYAILQQRAYNPGKSHLVYMTGVFASGTPASVALVYRTSTSGSVVDTTIDQADWNLDPMDGTGPSGITLDLTKTHILVIQAQWLGVGRVIMGFDIDGTVYPVHQFLHANILTLPYTQSFNLPVRLEGRSNGTNATFRSGYFDSTNGFFLQTVAATASGTINFVCCSVQTEGGEPSRGFQAATSNGITAIAVTTRRPVLSIRPKATHNSLVNRAHILLEAFTVLADTNDCFYELVLGGTLTGASFAAVATSSIAESDVAATAISGGVVLDAGYVTVTTGPGSVSAGAANLRGPLTIAQIDALATTQTILSIVATSFTGTSDVRACMTWNEQVI